MTRPGRDVSRPVETQRDMTRYSLTAELASLRFARAGVPRSPRTVMRYCSSGHLDCVKIDTDKNERYLVTPESVEKRTEELLSVDMSRHDDTRREPDQRFQSATTNDETKVEPPENEASRKEVEELKRENFDLKITNRGKDEFIKLLREERAQYVNEIKDQAHRIGELEERLRLPPGVTSSREPRTHDEVASEEMAERDATSAGDTTENGATTIRESASDHNEVISTTRSSDGESFTDAIHRDAFGNGDNGSRINRPEELR
jgi:hypothetical protein